MAECYLSSSWEGTETSLNMLHEYIIIIIWSPLTVFLCFCMISLLWLNLFSDKSRLKTWWGQGKDHRFLLDSVSLKGWRDTGGSWCRVVGWGLEPTPGGNADSRDKQVWVLKWGPPVHPDTRFLPCFSHISAPPQPVRWVSLYTTSSSLKPLSTSSSPWGHIFCQLPHWSLSTTSLDNNNKLVIADVSQQPYVMGAGLDMMTRSCPLETMNVTLLGNGIFADMIKVRIKVRSWWIGVALNPTRESLLGDERGGPETQKKAMWSRGRDGVMWPQAKECQRCGLHQKLEETGRVGHLAFRPLASRTQRE